jgi:hypothetical protein
MGLVGQVGNLRRVGNPPSDAYESGRGPIDNRPQLTKLPHKVGSRIYPAPFRLRRSSRSRARFSGESDSMVA